MPLPFFPQQVNIGYYTDWKYVSSFTLGALGTLYVPGSVISPVGLGTAPFGESTFTITTVNGSGGITGASTTVMRPYQAPYTLPLAFTTTSGPGSGATMVSLSLSPTPSVFAACPTVGAGFGVTPEISMSFWVCPSLTNDLTIASFDEAGVEGGFLIKVRQTAGSAGSVTYRVQVLISNSTNTLFSGIWTGTAPAFYQTIGTDLVASNEACVMVEFDTVGQLMSIYVNDTALANTSGGWITSGVIDTSIFTWQFFYSVVTGASVFGVADFWAAGLRADWANVNSRRQFINADLSAVSLPSDGEVTLPALGVTNPEVFLHTTSGGLANDFVLNGGAGPGWEYYNNLTGTPGGPLPTTTFVGLTFHTECTNITPIVPPVDPVKLNMDRVIVTSLRTESPCTLAEFAVAPTSDPPAIGLRWSDTRGATWGNAVAQSLGSDPYTQLQWNRTGMARDRVFELFWSAASNTALNGAFIDVLPLKS